MRGYHFTALRHALAALANQRLKVALIDELNDPFELLCTNLAHKKARKAFVAFKNYQAKRTGMLCFSRGWHNLLLWSHYADKHRGVALEFEIHQDLIEEVRYTKTRTTLDVPAIMKSGGFTEDHAAMIYATKSDHWRYEDEVRVSVALKDCIKDGDLRFEPFSDLLRPVGVIAGPLCSVTTAQIAQSLPRQTSLLMTRSRLAFKSFNVVANKAYRPEVIQGVLPR